MRLVSATVRNYRVHGEASVTFDPARTLIGGPNECGKSTLVEAIHRALFLKATVTGEALESMGSTLFQGRPEVEVRFEARGAEYQLTKRFSGQTGTVRLTQMGGQSWQGEEAETRLARLLGVEEVGGGKGILERVKKQWAHLWVWQGESGDDLSESVEAQQAGLLQRLQKVGGAVAMQSELDDRVACRFSQVRGDIYGKSTGLTALKNSELGQAQADVQKAEAAVGVAAERVNRLGQAMEAHEQAASAIARSVSALAGITAERQEVEQKLAEVTQLRRAEETQAQAVATAVERVAALEGVENNLAGLREAMRAAQQAVEPLEEKQRQLESKLAEARDGLSESQLAHDRVLEKAREAQLKAGLAGAYVTQFKRQARSQELSGRLERVQSLQKELDDLRAQSATVVAIDQSGLEGLQSLNNRSDQASAALRAMAAEVEVVATDRPVLVGGVPLAQGLRQTVSDTTEMNIGESVRIRIHPGGGDALARAREEVRSLERSLQQALDRYGLENLAAAAEAAARRADLQAKTEVKSAELRQWDVADLAALCKEAEAESAAIAADIERRQEQVGSSVPPQTLAQAEALLSGEQVALQVTESEERSLRSALEGLRQQTAERENERNQAREALEGERNKHTQLSAQVGLLLQNHGADEARCEALDQARSVRSRLEADLLQTRAALEVLQPDSLERDGERLQRAWKETDDQRQEAEKVKYGSQLALRSDGTDDPTAALSQAEAYLEAAQEHLTLVDRKARAIARVDELFQEEQRALADRFSKPLADKIDAYLQCVFGPEAKISVSLEDNHFGGVRLARSAKTGATPFDSLSKGAREQVAAAVRLAIAELLAADHDGTLPVVFDDAFAHSDPERVNALHRMLDLAAARGLQVVVLTCNPADYAGLGARGVDLGQAQAQAQVQVQVQVHAQPQAATA
jgi:DNA repair exonuclease SbcCD ATPase subunit